MAWALSNSHKALSGEIEVGLEQAILASNFYYT